MKTRSRGHLDVVEDHERVLLVEADGQRRSNGSAAGDAALSRHRNMRPGASIGMVKDSAYSRRRVGRQRVTGVHGELVGERGQRGQDPGPAHDDRVVGLADLVQRHRVVGEGLVASPGRSSGGRWCASARCRRGPAASGTRRGSRRPARCGPPARPGRALVGEPGERDVHVVGGAAHHADATPRRCGRDRDAAAAGRPSSGGSCG